MTRNGFIILIAAAAFSTGYLAKAISLASPAKSFYNTASIPGSDNDKEMPVKLGAFSMSLNVRDLKASKEFYENLGFVVFGGGMEKNYLIMKNGNALVGIFHGMFEGNILTFNPGWDENARDVNPFDDLRMIQRHLKSKGIKLSAEADEKTSGPAYLILADPDSNTIYIDQHR